MRSYYRPYQWAPNFTSASPPAPAAAQAAAPKDRRKGMKKAVLFFLLSLLIIAGLAAALAAATIPLMDQMEQMEDQPPDSSHSDWYDDPFGNDWDRSDSFEWTPPTIRQASTGNGPTLTLVSAGERDELSYGEIYDKTIPSIVGVYAYGDTAGSFGTGIILSGDGYIVTNAHVVAGSSQVWIAPYEGSALECDLVGFDARSDLAVLKVYPRTPLPAAEFGDSSQLHVGDSVAAIGNPLGDELWGTMTNGIISAVNRQVTRDNGDTMTLLQTSAALNSGNSGGALLNTRGQVIGITNMKIMSSDNSVEGLGFAIPSTAVKDAVDAMIATGTYDGPASIGITGSTGEGGVLVYSVDPNSDAFAKGLLPDDLITAVNGQHVGTVDDINAIKTGMKIGDTLTLTVRRGGETLTLEIALVGAYTLDQ